MQIDFKTVSKDTIADVSLFRFYDLLVRKPDENHQQKLNTFPNVNIGIVYDD